MAIEGNNDTGPSRVEALVALHSDIVNFGDESDAVGEDWLAMAEERLGVSFTPSYRWYLKRYKGGEICGEEIFSVYGVDFDSVSGGDIVHQHLLDVSAGLMPGHALVVSRTDVGEVFYFDYAKQDGEEVPIRLRLPSGKSEYYASNFYEFLARRISCYL